MTIAGAVLATGGVFGFAAIVLAASTDADIRWTKKRILAGFAWTSFGLGVASVIVAAWMAAFGL